MAKTTVADENTLTLADETPHKAFQMYLEPLSIPVN